MSVKFFLTDLYCHDTLTVLEQLVQFEARRIPMMAFSLMFLLGGGALLLALILLVIILANR